MIPNKNRRIELKKDSEIDSFWSAEDLAFPMLWQHYAGICQFSESGLVFPVAEVHWTDTQVRIDSKMTIWLLRVAVVLHQHDFFVDLCLKLIYPGEYLLRS